MRWHVHTVGQRPQNIPALFSIALMTATEAIKREPQREATRATAAPTPTPTLHSTACPGGGVSKTHGGRKPNFTTSSIGEQKRHGNRAIHLKQGRYAQDFDSRICVAVARVAFEGSLRTPKRR